MYDQASNESMHNDIAAYAERNRKQQSQSQGGRSRKTLRGVLNVIKQADH